MERKLLFMKRSALIIAGFLISAFMHAQVWVGGQNVLLNSQDGGTSYLQVDAPDWSYYGFYIGADDTTWIAGEAGGSHGARILETADDGASFYDTLAYNSGDITNYANVKGDIIRFPGTDSYMAVMEPNNSKNFITYDPGSDYWNKEEKMNGNQVTGVVTASSSDGYGVTAGNIWKTTDVGSSWDASYSLPGYNDVAVFGNGNIVAIGATGRASFSDDGGSTFSTPSGISGTDDLIAIEVAPSDSAGLIVTNNGSIWRTTDYGATWTSITTFSGSKKLNAIGYANNDTIIIGGDGDGPNDAHIHRSTDGGQNWSELSSDSAIFDLSTWVQNSSKPYIRDIHFSNENTGWLVLDRSYGDGGFVMRTSDGGETWKGAGNLADGVSYAVWGKDDSTAFASAKKKLYKTTDTGATWNQVGSSGDGWTIEDIYFKDANKGYFVIDDNYFKTTDGGDTWIEVNSSVGNTYLTGIDEDVISGSKGFVALTGDDGDTWNQVDVLGYQTGNYNSVDASGPSDAVAVGNNGYMLLTNDGGANWNFIGDNSAFTFDIADVQMFGSDTIFAVSKDGYAVKTTDGGTNWALDTIDKNASITLNDMDMPYSNMAIVVGDEGVMYKTADWTNWAELNSGTTDTLYIVDYSDTTNYCSAPSISIYQDSASCSNSTDGMAWVEVSDGEPPFSYVWNDAAGTEKDTLDMVPAGNYEVTITDACAAKYVKDTTVYAPQDSIDITLGMDSVLCAGGNTGLAYVEVNETGSFTFSWNVPSTNDTLFDVSAGDYDVTVEKPATGCKATGSVTVKEPAPLSTIMSVDSVSTYGGSDGKAWVTVSGGTPSYSYLWDDVGSTSGDTLKDVAAGTYTITVTDANGCTAVNDTTVPQPEDPLALFSVSTDNNLSVYPNPAENDMVNLSGAQGKLIKVINILGDVIYSKEGDKSVEQIHFKGKSGVFIIKVNDKAVKVLVK